MRVLITGGTGYIGLNLVNELMTVDRYEPVVLVRDSSDSSQLPDTVETVPGDVTKKETLREALEDVQTVVHLAAVMGSHDRSEEGKGGIDANFAELVNVTGTENVLKAASDTEIENVVYTSTIYAHPELSRSGGETIYQETKREADQLFTSNDWQFGFTILHPTYIVGKRDYRLSRYETFYMTASNRLMVPPLYIPGELNVIHMQDIVSSIIYHIDNPTNGRQILSNENISSREYIKMIARHIEGRTVVLPLPLYKQILPSVVDVLHRVGLSPVPGERLQDMQRNLGTVPEQYANRSPVELTSPEQAVSELYEWYKSVGLL